MEAQISQELFGTVVGMRNAGAERSAVLQRLQAEGFDFDAANAIADRVDTQIAQRYGARPADMPEEISDRAEAARQANLASTGLAPAPSKLPTQAHTPVAAVPAQLGSAQREKLASEGRVLLLAGMTEQALKAQWMASGVGEGAAQELVLSAQDLTRKHEARQETSKKRMNRAAVAVMAVLGGLGVFGIFLMLQPPTSGERATTIAASACGADEARLIEVRGQVLLLGGEAMNVKNSLSVEDRDFDELFQSGVNGEPDHLLCSVVSLLPIEYCDGYVDISVGGIGDMFRDDDEPPQEFTVQLQGSALIVKMLAMDDFQEQDSVRVETNPRCPEVYRGTFGETRREVHRPDAALGMEAIRELVQA